MIAQFTNDTYEPYDTEPQSKIIVHVVVHHYHELPINLSAKIILVKRNSAPSRPYTLLRLCTLSQLL